MLNRDDRRGFVPIKALRANASHLANKNGRKKVCYQSLDLVKKGRKKVAKLHLAGIGEVRGVAPCAQSSFLILWED